MLTICGAVTFTLGVIYHAGELDKIFQRQSAVMPGLILASSDRLSAAAFGHGALRWNPPLFVLRCFNVRSRRNYEARKAQDQALVAAH